MAGGTIAIIKQIQHIYLPWDFRLLWLCDVKGEAMVSAESITSGMTGLLKEKVPVNLGMSKTLEHLFIPSWDSFYV